MVKTLNEEYRDWTDPVIDALLGMLDANMSFAMGNIGDSTANGPDEWFEQGVLRFAQYMDINVVRRMWNPTTQDLDGPVFLQTGTKGERSARFIGSPLARARKLPKSEIAFPTGDQDYRARVKFDNVSQATDQYIMGATGGGGSRGPSLTLKANGDLSFTWSSDGTAFPTQSNALKANVALIAKQWKWVRATLDIDNGAGGYTLTYYTSDDGTTWTQVGQYVSGAVGATTVYDAGASVGWEIGVRNSTVDFMTGNISHVEIRNGIGGPIVSPMLVESWPQAFPSGSLEGSPTIYLFNSSEASQNLAYWNNATRATFALVPMGPGILFVNSTKNETTTGAALRALYDTLTTNVASRCGPYTIMSMALQNPLSDTHGYYTTDLQRTKEQALYAASKGHRLGPNLSRAFVNSSQSLSELLTADLVHPNQALGNPLAARAFAAPWIANLRRRNTNYR